MASLAAAAATFPTPKVALFLVGELVLGYSLWNG